MYIVYEILFFLKKIINLLQPTNNKKFLSSLWGPTADSYDLIVKDVMLPELEIGNWLIWKDMGAYSIALATTFNGFSVPHVIPIIRKSQWLVLIKKRIKLEIQYYYFFMYDDAEVKVQFVQI